jgi:hypothetical protein
VLFGQLLLSNTTRRVAGANVPYSFLGQFGEIATLSLPLPALRHLVSHVVRRRTESQVERVDTTWHVAKVHHLHAGRYGAISKFKSKAVGRNNDLKLVGGPVLDDAVAVLSDRASPQDAPGFRGLPDVVQERTPRWELKGTSPAITRAEFTTATDDFAGFGKEQSPTRLTGLLNLACLTGATVRTGTTTEPTTAAPDLGRFGQKHSAACFAGAADGIKGRHDGSPTKGRRVGGPVDTTHRLPQSFLHCNTGPAPLRTEN